MKGDTVFAKTILNDLLIYHEMNPHSWTWQIAAVYAALGKSEIAIDYLERDPIDFIHIAHWYKPLRNHPRFKKLLLKLGFDPNQYVN